MFVTERREAENMPEMTPRERREEAERLLCMPGAMLSAESRGRMKDEEPDEIRTCFQRDIDRIVHSKSFRRLKHKTQVFLQPEGDHYRTRMTHTIEVVRIARTISRALGLNEDLTEAVAWGHDLGHTPFGHAGERALAELCPEGFLHNEQSLRVVDVLEKDGRGLNLTFEVRDGILNHVGEGTACTLEGRVVRLADRLAYINHDVDDAIRAGILSADDIPADISRTIGVKYSQRLNSLIKAVIEYGEKTGEVGMEPFMTDTVERFHEFMYARVYRNPVAKGEESKVLGVLDGLNKYYLADLSRLPEDYRTLLDSNSETRVVCDYISGMTDKFAIDKFEEIYVPAAWKVR